MNGWKAAVAAAALVAVSMWMSACGSDTPVESRTTSPLEFSGGVLVTDAWVGEWNIVSTFTECEGGATTMVEDVIDVVCSGDTLRLAGSRLFAYCGGTATDSHVDVDCDYHFDDGACNVRVVLKFTLDRNGEALTGSGVWSTSVSAGCSDLYPVGCEHISITGTRLSADVSPCGN
jgi:hypothetical protein